MITAEKTLEDFVTFDVKNNNDMIRKDCTINAMEEYGEMKWNEACKQTIADFLKVFLNKKNDEIVLDLVEEITCFPMPEYR